MAQGAIQLLFPAHFQRLAIGVDLIHTATMAALAALDPPRRRPALVTAGFALGSAVTGLAIRSLGRSARS